MTVLVVMLGVVVGSAAGLQTPGKPQSSPVQAEKPPVNPDARALADFNERVKKYMELHNKLEATLPKLPEQAEPGRIAEHQTQFAKLIAQTRATAKPGDIFTQPVRQIFRRVLRNALRGPAGQKVRAEILDENTKPVPLRINAPYPSDVPLSTIPPKVLEVLPRLPDGLEYRFVDRHLILFDNHANVIADYMANGLP
jgi:hypothetical protein